MQTQYGIYVEEFMTIVVSNSTEPIVLCGRQAITELRKVMISYFKSENIQPKYVENNIPMFTSHLKVDEFVVTFFEWLRLHECSDPDCAVRKDKEAFTDLLISRTLNQTAYFIDGRITESQYHIYQCLCNLLDLGMSMPDARNATQRFTNTIIDSYEDKFTADSN